MFATSRFRARLFINGSYQTDRDISSSQNLTQGEIQTFSKKLSNPKIQIREVLNPRQSYFSTDKKNRRERKKSKDLVEFTERSPHEDSSTLLIREGIPEDRAFTLTAYGRFKFAQRAATYFFVKCIPHPRAFVKVLHGIAVKPLSETERYGEHPAPGGM